MKNNQLLRSGEIIIRVLDIKDGQAFIIDCKRQTVPKWVDIDTLTEYETCPDDVLDTLPNINDLDPQSRKFAYEHFTYIAGVLPFVTDKKRRCEAITQITEERRISKQTVCNYLWLYLVYQNIAALSPKTATIEKPLTEDEKNIRWALNKFFYTKRKNSLNTAYTLMLKEKYCDAEGVLLPQYPSFYQFRYYYRTHKKMQNYYISRNGIKNYQRNNRPLLGDGIQEFADYQERGAHDYRKDARLTMANFEKIILRCIVYYNSQRIVENFPYTEKMLADDVKPYASEIWNYGLNQAGANLIPADYNTLVLTLLPRTTGKFSRKGLIVNKLRYKHDGFTERYLNGGTVTVAYNPDDVAEVWLIENDIYTPFTLIESRFCGKGISEVEAIKARQKTAVQAVTMDNLQAKIDLVNHIGIIAASAANQGNTSIKGIRDNRRKEQQKTHIDYVKESSANE